MTASVTDPTAALGDELDQMDDGADFLDELVECIQAEDRARAIDLIELNALRAEGSISDDEFAARKASLFR
jgi:hypothetical protein